MDPSKKIQCYVILAVYHTTMIKCVPTAKERSGVKTPSKLMCVRVSAGARLHEANRPSSNNLQVEGNWKYRRERIQATHETRC